MRARDKTGTRLVGVAHDRKGTYAHAYGARVTRFRSWTPGDPRTTTRACSDNFRKYIYSNECRPDSAMARRNPYCCASPGGTRNRIHNACALGYIRRNYAEHHPTSSFSPTNIAILPMQYGAAYACWFYGVVHPGREARWESRITRGG